MRRLACGGRLGDFKQHCARLHVSDLEPGEVDAVNVFIWAAEVIWRRGEMQSLISTLTTLVQLGLTIGSSERLINLNLNLNVHVLMMDLLFFFK